MNRLSSVSHPMDFSFAPIAILRMITSISWLTYHLIILLIGVQRLRRISSYALGNIVERTFFDLRANDILQKLLIGLLASFAIVNISLLSLYPCLHVHIDTIRAKFNAFSPHSPICNSHLFSRNNSSLLNCLLNHHVYTT